MLTRQTNGETPRRSWRLLVGGGLCAAALAAVGIHSVREARADDQEDAIRKALDNLKNGTPPAPEQKDKPSDLNPVDEFRRNQEALNAARQKLRENPEDEQAKKEIEDLSKKIAEGMKNNRFAPQVPNFPMLPLQPLNPADLDKEIERMLLQQRQMFEQQMRQMQGNRMLFLNGNRIGIAGMNRVRPGDTRLGVRIEKPNVTLVEQLNLPDNQGIVVVEVYPETPAAKAGLRPNDILLEIDGKPVSSEAGELQQMLREIMPDAKVDVVVLRKGKKETLKEVALPAAGNREANPAAEIFPNLGGLQNGLNLQEFGNGARISSVSVSMSNGEFTIRANQDGVKYTITGHKDDGGPQATSIEIDDNGTVTKADKLDKVDEQHKPMVENLLKRIR